MTLTQIREAQPVNLDHLINEAERMGNLRIWTQTEGWSDAGRRKGYKVTLFCSKGRSEVKVEVTQATLSWALADVINEARSMGMGEVD